MSKLLNCVIASSCLLGVVACDPSDGDDADEALPVNITQWGLIDIDTEDEVEIAALFGQFVGAGLSATQFQTDLIPDLDECEVDTVAIVEAEGGDGDDDLDIEFSEDFDYISAGESIFINSAGGSYAMLSREIDDEDDTIFYFMEVGSALIGPAPSNLSVSIPGDIFPAFSTVAIPNVAELEFSSPMDGELITPSTQFVWNAGSSNNSYVNLSATYIDDALTEVTVDCLVIDDGEFSLPAATQAELGTEFSTEDADFSRTSYSITTVNGATVAVRNTTDI